MVRWNLAMIIIPLCDDLVMPVCLRQARFHVFRVIFLIISYFASFKLNHLKVPKKGNPDNSIVGVINPFLFYHQWSTAWPAPLGILIS
jgi:hypothetical protein